MRNYTDPRREQKSAGEAFVRLGMMTLHSIWALLRIIGFFAGGVLRMLWYMLRQCGRLFRWIGSVLRFSFAEHSRPAQEILQDVRHARKEGGRQVWHQFLRLLGNYIFGEHGILRTGFNYVLPVVSVVFLIGVIHYASGLDYAISVVCNGEEIGLIEEQSDFEEAEEEVRQRVAMAGEELELNFHPVYSLRIVSDGDRYLSKQSIADKLLAGSNADLTEAYGVYVDGEFLGAVEDTEAISDGMSAALNTYASGLDNLVEEVYYTKEITYQEGTYLTESLSDPEEILKTLTSETQQESRYAVQKTDSPELVAAKYGMTVEKLTKLNPEIEERFEPGMLLRVTTASRYIPIAHTRNLTMTSYIGYPTVRVETAALNLGVEKVLSKGVIGERSSQVKVTYIDGAESSREVLSTAVIREPIPEQVGVGTYSAQPASTSTVLTGTGEFGWPVNGGYISDTFISNRNHKGLDIAAPMGTEIYAGAAGTVYTAGWNSGGYGNYVIIDHPNGYRTYYAHCSRVVCYAGQEVEKGQLIAYVGSTGDSTGPHCHFEVRVDNIPVNPASYLRVNAN